MLAVIDPGRRGLPLLLIRRSRVVGSHRGQIAFPGGAAEVHDDGIAGTALREACEEVGVPADAVEVLGCLPPLLTATSGRRVDCVVGLLGRAVEPRSDDFEVGEIFWVPLTSLLAAPVTARSVPGVAEGRPVVFIDLGDRIVWGATGAMLVDLLDRLRAALELPAARPV